MWLLVIPVVWFGIGAIREKRHVDQVNSMPLLPGASKAKFQVGSVLLGPFAQMQLK